MERSLSTNADDPDTYFNLNYDSIYNNNESNDNFPNLNENQIT